METESFHGLKLLAHCGGGAYGDVYYCEDPSGKRMALKIVSKKRLGDAWEKELNGVINYRKITENENPLLKIFHVAEDEEIFYYTMEPADSVSESEYIPDTLARRLQNGPLPSKELSAIINGVFEGINAIHKAGFTHRDIKPENILFVNSVPKLADIGLLSSLSGTITQLAGTLEFIPPEERLADSLKITDRNGRKCNDLYAFGKVIYCAVTGNAPSQFPSVPPDLPLLLPLKYYLALAFRLCDKESFRRLNSIDVLDKELSDIQRKITCGETFNDYRKEVFRNFKTCCWTAVIYSCRLSKRFWYLMFLFFLVGGSTAYWIKKPDPPTDMSKIKTKLFRSQHFGLSMTIPAQWETMPQDMIKREIERGHDPNKKIDRKRLEAAEFFMKAGLDWLCIDFSDNPEGVTIQYISNPTVNPLVIPHERLRVLMKQSMMQMWGNEPFIYELKNVTVAGYKAVYVDYSGIPGYRGAAYYFYQKNKLIMMTLICKVESFLKNKKYFEAAVATLKFEK